MKSLDDVRRLWRWIKYIYLKIIPFKHKEMFDPLQNPFPALLAFIRGWGGINHFSKLKLKAAMRRLLAFLRSWSVSKGLLLWRAEVNQKKLINSPKNCLLGQPFFSHLFILCAFFRVMGEGSVVFRKACSPNSWLSFRCKLKKAKKAFYVFDIDFR